jgi:hypothetical protein
MLGKIAAPKMGTTRPATILQTHRSQDGASPESVPHCPRHARAQLRHPEIRRQSSRYGLLCEMPAQVLYSIRLSARPRRRGAVFAGQVRDAQVSRRAKEITIGEGERPRSESTRPAPYLKVASHSIAILCILLTVMVPQVFLFTRYLTMEQPYGGQQIEEKNPI